MSETNTIRRVQVPEPIVDEENKKDFIDWVQEQIGKMKGYLRLGADVEVSFVELQKALTGYAHVYNTLISMYHEARISHQWIEEDYKTWYGERYLIIRNEANRADLAASKWLTASEIEFRVMAENKQVFLARKRNLLEAERKVSFLRDLIEMWKAYQRNLSDISSNLRAEIGMARMDRGI